MEDIRETTIQNCFKKAELGMKLTSGNEDEICVDDLAALLEKVSLPTDVKNSAKFYSRWRCYKPRVLRKKKKYQFVFEIHSKDI